MNKRKIFSDYIFNLFRTILNVAMPMITLPYVLNRIGPEHYGIFSYSNSVVSYFTMLAVLGIPNYAARAISRVKGTDRLSTVTSEIYLIQFISVTLAAVIFYLGFYPLFPEEQKVIFLILSIQIGANYFNTEWFFIGEQKFKYMALRSIIVKILNFTAIILFVEKGDNSHIYALIIALTGLLNGLVNLYGILPHLRLRGLNLKPHIKPILVLFALSVTGMINSNIDKTLTGLLVGPLYVGYYSVGFRLTRIIQQLFSSMNSIIFPRVTHELVTEGEGKAAKLIRFNMNYIFMFSCPIFLGLSLYADEIILLFFEAELLPATVSLIILTASIPVIAVLNILRQQVLLARDKDKVLFLLALISTMSNIVFNLLLVPNFQHAGAAFATLMAESSGLLFGLIYAWRKFRINLFTWTQAKYLLAAPVLLIPYYGLMAWEGTMHTALLLGIRIVTSVLIYFTALYILKDDFFYRYSIKILRKMRQRSGSIE